MADDVVVLPTPPCRGTEMDEARERGGERSDGRERESGGGRGDAGRAHLSANEHKLEVVAVVPEGGAEEGVERHWRGRRRGRRLRDGRRGR